MDTCDHGTAGMTRVASALDTLAGTMAAAGIDSVAHAASGLKGDAESLASQFQALKSGVEDLAAQIQALSS